MGTGATGGRGLAGTGDWGLVNNPGRRSHRSVAMSAPDRELVERARQGDGIAIGELFSRYWRAARAAAFGVTGEWASAEDAAAEGFRQAWTGLDSLRDPGRFGPWLRRIVVRKARLVSHGRPSATDETLDELASRRGTAGRHPGTAAAFGAHAAAGACFAGEAAGSGVLVLFRGLRHGQRRPLPRESRPVRSAAACTRAACSSAPRPTTFSKGGNP